MKKQTTTKIVAVTLGVIALASHITPTAYAETDARAQQAREYYQMGITAMHEGKFDLARTSFREVLRLYPKHPQARKQLIYLSNNQNTLAVNRRKAALKRVIIPKVDLDNATINEAIEMLSAQIARESKNKVSSNFIVQDPAGAFKGRKVTLRLSRIPAETLLRYIADQAGGFIRYDTHAVIISPREKSKPAAPKQNDSPFAN